ncbi:zeta toxin family protein [Streptomyces niveus]|uniref:zeta toxin family protein n=1 Tax=Streptomyces niveus TaxID=193462 RepID=UPI003629F5CC
MSELGGAADAPPPPPPPPEPPTDAPRDGDEPEEEAGAADAEAATDTNTDSETDPVPHAAEQQLDGDHVPDPPPMDAPQEAEPGNPSEAKPPTAHQEPTTPGTPKDPPPPETDAPTHDQPEPPTHDQPEPPSPEPTDTPPEEPTPEEQTPEQPDPPKQESEPEPEPEPEPDPEPEPEREPEPELEPKPEPEREAERKPEPEADPEPDPESEPEEEPDPERDPEPKPESKPVPDHDRDHDADAHTDADAGPESEAEPEPATEPGPEPEGQRERERELRPDPDAVQDTVGQAAPPPDSGPSPDDPTGTDTPPDQQAAETDGEPDPGAELAQTIGTVAEGAFKTGAALAEGAVDHLKERAESASFNARSAAVERGLAGAGLRDGGVDAAPAVNEGALSEGKLDDAHAAGVPPPDASPELATGDPVPVTPGAGDGLSDGPPGADDPSGADVPSRWESTLSPDRLTQIYESKVRGEIFKDYVGGEDSPTAIFVGGPPGSGKSYVMKGIREEFGENVVILDADTLREFHPDYDKVLAEDPQSMPDVTSHAIGKWTEMAIAESQDGKYNVAIEGTFRNPEVLRRTAESFGDEWRKEVRAVAVPEGVSRLGTLDRFTSVENGRWVPPRMHDEAYTNNPVTLAGAFESKAQFARISVSNRRETIADSVRNDQGEYAPDRSEFLGRLESAREGALDRDDARDHMSAFYKTMDSFVAKDQMNDATNPVVFKSMVYAESVQPSADFDRTQRAEHWGRMYAYGLGLEFEYAKEMWDW